MCCQGNFVGGITSRGHVVRGRFCPGVGSRDTLRLCRALNRESSTVSLNLILHSVCLFSVVQSFLSSTYLLLCRVHKNKTDSRDTIRWNCGNYTPTTQLKELYWVFEWQRQRYVDDQRYRTVKRRTNYQVASRLRLVLQVVLSSHKRCNYIDSSEGACFFCFLPTRF